MGDEPFNGKNRLLGKGNRNKTHIETESKSQLKLVKGPRGELAFKISATNKEDLAYALETTQDLVRAMAEDYDTWKKDGGKEDPETKSTDEKKEKGKGDRKKGKGKGKNKDRKHDDKDRSHEGESSSKRRHT